MLAPSDTKYQTQHILLKQAGYDLEVEDYHFTILLGNPEKPMLQLNKGYSGDGGIP